MNKNKVLATIAGVALLTVCILGLSSCAKVPVQAVVLSRTVGERLPDLQASHEKFVRAYFQVSRERLEDFLDKQWIPEFLGTAIADTHLMTKLGDVQPFTDEQNARLKAKLDEAGISGSEQAKVVRAVGNAFGDPDRGKMVLQWSEAALEQIQAKRKFLLDPIDAQEDKTLDELRKVYAQLEQAQSTVTAHLSSIRNVTEEQDKVLERLNLLRSRDQLIEGALKTNDEIVGLIDAGKSVKDTFDDLQKKINDLKNTSTTSSQPNQ